MANDDHDDDYEVGYGRPPRHTRFCPGRSGNPKGRPKRAAAQREDFSDVVFDMLDEPIDVMRRGKPVRMSVKKAMMRQVINHAAKGNLKAAEFLDKLLTRANARRADQIRIDRPDELPEADEAVIARYLRRRGDTPGDGDDQGGPLQRAIVYASCRQSCAPIPPPSSSAASRNSNRRPCIEATGTSAPSPISSSGWRAVSVGA